MVVADLKGTLLRQAEPRREACLGQLGHQLGELFAEMHLVGGAHLLQMLLSQLDQRREGRCRGGTGRVEVPVFDGGVDAGIGDALDRLQHREETPQNIGDIAAFVQAHGKYLLVELGGVVAEIIGFQDGGAAPGDFPFGPDAEGHAVEQGGGIGSAGEDGPEQIAHQLGRWIFVPGFLVDRLLRQRPDRQVFPLVEGGAGDAEPVGVVLQIFGKLSEAAVQEEPDREPGRVGRDAQHIEVLVRVQLVVEEGDGASLRKGFQCGGKVTFRDAACLGTTAEKHQHGV